MIFEKGVQATFKSLDDLASLWCQYTEMELRHDNFERALVIMRKATAPPSAQKNFARKYGF